METVRIVNWIISIIFFVCYTYQFLYIAVPFIWKDKPHGKEGKNRYAVLISARNEELVIGHLIDSIKSQTYDKKLVTVFVVADNCTDNTATAAAKAGAIVFERFDSNYVGKGYALNYLLKQIEELPVEPFDGYFVFDADNILDENYITEMNRTFSDGYEIITSYRNSKNYGDNWISAGYALWFLRESRFLNHSRMLLGTSSAVSGTGFLFSREVLEACGGWNFFLLTEDIEFTVHNIVAGRKVGFCPKAMLYDEQPTKFSQSWRQRMRWSKGYLQVFGKYGGQLVRGIFRGSFACYDMSMLIMPAAVLSFVALIVNGTAAIFGIAAGQDVLVVVESCVSLITNAYLTLLLIGGITTICEWKNIYTSPVKKILYTFTFPLFMLTYIPISFVALFSRRVTWQPIEHTKASTLADIRREAMVERAS